MFEKLSRFRRGILNRKSNAVTRSSRLFVELLEDRLTPAFSIVTWNLTTGGSFDVAANWTVNGSSPPVHRVPVATDVAVIGSGVSGSVTAAGGETVGELICNTQLEIQGLTFTVLNNIDVSASSVQGIQVDSGAVFLTSAGTTSITAGGTLNGTLSAANSATVNFTSGTTTVNNVAALTGAGLYDVTGGGAVLTFATANPSPTNFELDNGTITGPGTLTIGTTFTWTGGTLSTTTTNVSVNGTVNLSNQAIATLTGGTLNNAGTMTWSGSSNWQINNGAVFNNSGTFTVSSDATIQEFGTSMFNNSGTFTKTSAANHTTTIQVQFNNTNQLKVTSGTLAFDMGGSNTGTNTGPINVSSGATLEAVSGTFNLNAGSALNGTGTYLVNGGGATLTFNTDISLANLTLSQGTVNGPNKLTITNQFTWNGNSTMGGAGTTVIPSGATMNISNGGGAKALDFRTLNLMAMATGTWSGAADWDLEDGAVFNNSGTFTINTDQTIQNFFGQGNATINNSGTIIKTSPIGSGTTLVNAILNNSGTVTVTSGILDIGGGGSDSGNTTVATGQQMLFTGGTFNLNTGFSLNGTGLYAIGAQGADLNANVNGSVTNLNLASGELSGIGTFAVTGTFNWTGGTVGGGSFILNEPANAMFNLTGNLDKDIDKSSVNLGATTNWLGSGNIALSNGGTLNNLANGVFNIQNDQQVNGIGIFNNAGTITKSTTLGTTQITFAVTFTNNSGTVNVQTGTLDAAGGYTQNAGTMSISSGAALISSSNHTVTIDGGTLAGSGNIGSVSSSTNVVNGGTVAPGGVGTAGTLEITGNYTQGANGTLAIDLGGHTAGTQFDQLVISGTVNLMAGSILSLTDINSFVPGNGDSYTIMTLASSTGSFATVGGPAVTSSFGFAPTYNPKDVTLQVSTSPGTLQFANPSPVVNESTGTAVITVTRTGGSAGTVAVQYAALDGTGVAGTKYKATSGTLTFASGVTSQTFSVMLLNDGQIDGDETVNLKLSHATGGAALGTPSTSTLTVEDTNGSQVERYVATVYWFILNRHVDQSGLQTWTNFILGGGNRVQMARTIENSVEYRQDEVEALYHKYLGRAADSGGLANFVNFLGNGGTVEQVAAYLVGSPEYFSSRGLNSVAGFLTAIYGDALGRTPDSVGAAAFTLAIKSGASTAAVATAIFGSSEYLGDDVNGYYLQFLRRPADSAGLNNWIMSIQAGQSRDEDVIANLIGSAEFLNNLIGP